MIWRDVDFLERTLTIWHSKTAAGERGLPLNGDAMAAILELRDRAKAFGGTDPQHFVYSHPANATENPIRANRCTIGGLAFRKLLKIWWT